MKVLRLHFDNDEPLDVRSKDVVDITPTKWDDCVGVRVTDGPRGGETTLVPNRVEFCDRDPNSNIDLK